MTAGRVRGPARVVGPGEVVPLDGRLEGGPAVLDESALTGEAAAVERPVGAAVRSGVVNGGGPFDLRVTTLAVRTEVTLSSTPSRREAGQSGHRPWIQRPG